jgi:hypothetical protein
VATAYLHTAPLLSKQRHQGRVLEEERKAKRPPLPRSAPGVNLTSRVLEKVVRESVMATSAALVFLVHQSIAPRTYMGLSSYR